MRARLKIKQGSRGGAAPSQGGWGGQRPPSFLFLLLKDLFPPSSKQNVLGTPPSLFFVSFFLEAPSSDSPRALSQVAGSSSHERPTKAHCGGSLSCKALRYETFAYCLAMDALVIALMER